MALDLAVARAVMAARQIERALHDQGPWTIRFNDVDYPAVRWIGEDRVIFRAYFPDACWLSEDPAPVDLVCSGEVVGTRLVEAVDGESSIEWVFVLPEREPARA